MQQTTAIHLINNTNRKGSVMTTNTQLAEMIRTAYRVVMYPGTEHEIECEVLDVTDTEAQLVDINSGEEYTVELSEFDLTRDFLFTLTPTEQVEEAVVLLLDKGTEDAEYYTVNAVENGVVYYQDEHGEQYQMLATTLSPDSSELMKLTRYTSMEERLMNS